MPPRFVYCCQLPALGSLELPMMLANLRHPTLSDAEPLAHVMLDAYRGTIDDGGETLDDARAEVASFFAAAPPPLLDCSWVSESQQQLLAACLVGFWAERSAPFIAYLITGTAYKQQGLARQLVRASLASLAAAGYHQVWAVITAGNQPSERLLTSLGFVAQHS